jgi:hypothetical protein
MALLALYLQLYDNFIASGGGGGIVDTFSAMRFLLC